jgi:cephalosporin-C deacetylase
MFDHEFPFDPTYSYDKAALLKVSLPEAPDDFAPFWRDTFNANANVSLNTVVTPVDSPNAAYNLSIAEFDTLAGYRVGAWVVYPKSGDVEIGFVTSHGFSGRTAPDFGLLADKAAAIYPSAPGFNLSASRDLPNEKMAHVVHGISSRETYLIRPCVTSIWSAATLLLELFRTRRTDSSSPAAALVAVWVPSHSPGTTDSHGPT